jgi:YidC/Oxa1 family membrane protein insertase
MFKKITPLVLKPVRIMLWVAVVATGSMMWFHHTASLQKIVKPNALPQATSLPEVIQTPVLSLLPPIMFTTHTLRVVIQPIGGKLLQVALQRYALTRGQPERVITVDETHQAGLALTGVLSDQHQTYHLLKKPFWMPSMHRWAIVLESSRPSGYRVQKWWLIPNDGYDISVMYRIFNPHQQPILASAMAWLTQPPATGRHSWLSAGSYEGAAVSFPGQLYKKLSSIEKHPFSIDAQKGWMAFQRRYFINAWVPSADQTCHYKTTIAQQPTFTAQTQWPLHFGWNRRSWHLFSGPQLATLLRQTSRTLVLTVDYGWLGMIAMPMAHSLRWIQSHLISNWGWSIVCITLIIKGLFWTLTNRSYRTMAHLKRLQPKLDNLKKQYAGDKTQMSQAIMTLYRKEGVSPMGGCLPMLLQIPFFIALYWVLLSTVELRQAPFLGWLYDLSEKDPYYILPIINGALMFIQQRFNPPASTSEQKMVMTWMPAVMTVLFLNFPSGLLLYWITNTLFGLIQQGILFKHLRHA